MKNTAYIRDAKKQYQDAHNDLRLNGFIDCSKVPPPTNAYYHFIDATGKTLSGFFTGKIPLTGEFAVGDINNGGKLDGIFAVLCKPMTKDEVTM